MGGAIRYPVSRPVLAGREQEFVADALASGWISSAGPYVEQFEHLFAQIVGFEQCLSTCNGTAALHLACMAMGLQPGMEVVVPSLTYVATGNAAAYCGARPVFAESDSACWNLTRRSVEAAWTPRTVGVIAVHLYGIPAPVDELADLCRARGAWLIEDCAESLGATLNGNATGTFGDASIWSFYGNKTISTGEGGMIAVRDPERYAAAKLLRNQGMDPTRRYWHPVIGYNYRMTNIAAAIGLGQLQMFDHHVNERRRVAAAYRKGLATLVADGALRLPAKPAGSEPSYWLFSAVVADGGSARRERIQQILHDEWAIETRPFFVPMHRLPMYAQATPNRQPLPIAEFLGSSGLSFPTYAGLPDEDIAWICQAVEEAMRRTTNIGSEDMWRPSEGHGETAVE